MKIKVITFFLVALLFLPFDSPLSAQNGQLQPEAGEFLKKTLSLLDQEKYQESYSLVSPLLKLELNNYLSMMRERKDMGQVRNRTLAETKTVEKFADLPPGQYILVIYNTSFEHQPKAQEYLVLDRAKTGEYALAGYQIKFNRWPVAVRIIFRGLFIVFLVMALLGVMTWVVGKLVQKTKKENKAASTDKE